MLGLIILSCRKQENLVGDFSGDTSLIIETSPTKFSCSRHDKIINNMNAEQTNQNNIFTTF